MATETQTPIAALERMLHDHGNSVQAVADAREALRRVFSLVAAAEALNDDPDTLLELEAALVPFQAQP